RDRPRAPRGARPPPAPDPRRSPRPGHAGALRGARGAPSRRRALAPAPHARRSPPPPRRGASPLMHALSLLRSVFDWRSRAVLGRNFKVFLRNWKTAMLPPAMEPVVYFAAFGIGLATYVGGVPHEGRMVDYGSWVAPGMMAYTAFATPYYEALYSAYVRMFYQKTWDGILATQVEIRHLVWGEILWAALRGVSNVTVVTLVLYGFSLAGWLSFDLAALPAVMLLAALAGAAFAAFALIFTAIVPAIDHMNYPVFLIGLPLSFVSHTYFPI